MTEPLGVGDKDVEWAKWWTRSHHRPSICYFSMGTRGTTCFHCTLPPGHQGMHIAHWDREGLIVGVHDPAWTVKEGL